MVAGGPAEERVLTPATTGDGGGHPKGGASRKTGPVNRRGDGNLCGLFQRNRSVDLILCPLPLARHCAHHGPRHQRNQLGLGGTRDVPLAPPRAAPGTAMRTLT